MILDGRISHSLCTIVPKNNIGDNDCMFISETNYPNFWRKTMGRGDSK